jgi:hypothetical protein
MQFKSRLTMAMLVTALPMCITAPIPKSTSDIQVKANDNDQAKLSSGTPLTPTLFRAKSVSSATTAFPTSISKSTTSMAMDSSCLGETPSKSKSTTISLNWLSGTPPKFLRAKSHSSATIDSRTGLLASCERVIACVNAA